MARRVYSESLSPDEIKRQQRMMHVRDGRLIVGVEGKDGTISSDKQLSFAYRAAIAYVNRQRILGSAWPDLSKCPKSKR